MTDPNKDLMKIVTQGTLMAVATAVDGAAKLLAAGQTLLEVIAAAITAFATGIGAGIDEAYRTATATPTPA